MARKILVTGATGFIGSHLVRFLVQNGDSVRVLVRDPKKWAQPLSSSLELCQGDLRDVSSLATAVKDIDAIVHLAGLVHASKRRDLFEVNGHGTERLGEATLAAGRRKVHFLYVSSLSAAGPNRGDQPIRESDWPQPVSDYGRSKLLGEERLLAQGAALRLSILRPPVVYGPGDVGVLLFFKLVQGKIVPLIVDPQTQLSFVHVEDFCRGVLHALDRAPGNGERYFISGEETPRVAEALLWMAEGFGKNPRFLKLPFTLSWILAAGADFYSRCSGKSFFLSRDKLKELSAPGWYCSNEKAKRELGFLPQVPLKQGIQQTANWYRENGWL